MSMSLYDKIISQRGAMERIVARIPGFKGYLDKQARRTADQMLRQYLAAQLQDKVNEFARAEKKLLDKTGLQFMSKTRDIKGVMQTFQDRVETAAPKYDGMWAQIKIDSEDLERIYAFDEALVRYVDSFGDLVSKFAASIDEGGDAIEQALDAIYGEATEANEAFKLRDDVITNIAGTL